MTSVAESLTATGMIPPMSGADLKAPSDATTQKSPEKTSEQSIVAAGEGDIKSSLQKISSMQPPPMPQFKEAPKFETSDPVGQGYASAIGILGALGSMFTRRPMTASMNTAAAVVTAMKAGDQEAFKQNMEKWKIDNENIKALSDYQQTIYKDILDNSKLELDAKIGMLQAHAAAFKDDATLALTKQGNLTAIEQLNLDREKAQHTWQKESAEAEKLVTENNARNEQMRLLKQERDSGQLTDEQYMQGLQGIATGKAVTSTPTLSTNTIDFLARQALTGDKSVFTNMGRQASGAANVSAIRERMNELAEEQGISPEELARRSQQFAGDSAGQRTLSNRVAAISEAGAAVGEVPTKDNPGSGAAKMAIEASEKVPRGKFVPLNEAELAYRKGTSDPAVAAFVVATNTLINEYSNATNPTGKGTVADRKHARDLLSNAQSKTAYKAAVSQMVKEKDNSLSKAKQAKKEFLDDESGSESVTDFPLPPPDAIKDLQTNPSTAEQFDEVFGPGAAAKILEQQ